VWYTSSKVLLEKTVYLDHSSATLLVRGVIRILISATVQKSGHILGNVLQADSWGHWVEVVVFNFVHLRSKLVASKAEEPFVVKHRLIVLLLHQEFRHLLPVLPLVGIVSLGR